MLPLIENMTLKRPNSRPTAADALKQFDDITKHQPIHVTKWRIKQANSHPLDNLIDNLASIGPVGMAYVKSLISESSSSLLYMHVTSRLRAAGPSTKTRSRLRWCVRYYYLSLYKPMDLHVWVCAIENLKLNIFSCNNLHYKQLECVSLDTDNCFDPLVRVGKDISIRFHKNGVTLGLASKRRNHPQNIGSAFVVSIFGFVG